MASNGPAWAVRTALVCHEVLKAEAVKVELREWLREHGHEHPSYEVKASFLTVAVRRLIPCSVAGNGTRAAALELERVSRMLAEAGPESSDALARSAGVTVAVKWRASS